MSNSFGRDFLALIKVTRTWESDRTTNDQTFDAAAIMTALRAAMTSPISDEDTEERESLMVGGTAAPTPEKLPPIP